MQVVHVCSQNIHENTRKILEFNYEPHNFRPRKVFANTFFITETPCMRLTYGPSRDTIVSYCDSDYAADIDDCKSRCGFVFMLNVTAISWQSKPVVALSTVETEFTALAFATREALWLRSL